MAVKETAPPQSKTELAKKLGVSRSSLYYQPKLPAKDLQLKAEIEQVLEKHQAYGHKRIALALQINKKRVRRVMKVFNLSPRRKRKQRPFKPKDRGQAPMAIPNLVFGITIDVPHEVWASDFTYLPYTDRFIYLATLEDMFTRLVVGWALGTRHNDTLTSQALVQAVTQYHPPKIAHSDQGSEYRSQRYLNLLHSFKIRPSMSEKASPWQNGHQESFYSGFKFELGHPTCYGSIGELTEAVAQQIYYYNNERIHTALKCPPAVYVQRINFQKSLNHRSIEKGQLV